MTGATFGLRNLRALPSRFWNNCRIWVGSASTVGKVPTSTFGAGLFDQDFQVGEDFGHEGIEVYGTKGLAWVVTRERASRSLMSRRMRSAALCMRFR